MYPKFVITDTGLLRIGMVRLHKELLLPGEACIGGGWYEFDWVSSRLVLSGESSDFGRPRWDRLEKLSVPEAYLGLRIVYARNGRADDGGFAVDEILKIEYI